MCENQIVSEIPSPDKLLKVVIFERSCGATTDFSTQISLLALSSSLPDDVGNIFAADANHGRAQRAAWGGPEVQVTWTSNRNLRIQYHQAARIFRAEKQLKDVNIDYDILY